MSDPLPSTADPIAIVLEERRQQREICDALESIADQLRGNVSIPLCKLVLRRLDQDLPLYLKDEVALAEILLSHHGEPSFAKQCLELVKSEHLAQEAFALELQEPLTEICQGKVYRRINMIGYALRCCFEGMRRHLDWEDLVLFGDRLENQPIDTTLLTARLARNRSQDARHLRLA